MTEKNEVLNVEVHSARPDGYRRGGFRLNRGTNHLEMVVASALSVLQRDKNLLVKTVVACQAHTENQDGGLSRGEIALSVQVPVSDAGAQLLADDVDPLLAMIASLTPEQFTQSGLPDTKALSALAGRPVPAAERDTAWQQYQQRQQSQE